MDKLANVGSFQLCGQIRRRIEDDPPRPKLLQTVWREGYRPGDPQQAGVYHLFERAAPGYTACGAARRLAPCLEDALVKISLETGKPEAHETRYPTGEGELAATNALTQWRKCPRVNGFGPPRPKIDPFLARFASSEWIGVCEKGNP